LIIIDLLILIVFVCLTRYRFGDVRITSPSDTSLFTSWI